MAAAQHTVRIDGRSIRLSNLDKVLYPASGTTKGEVLGYVSAIAETMIPHCRDRAATRKRWPDGVGENGEASSFFQKDIGEDAPAWVPRGRIDHRNHRNAYPVVNDESTLVWLTQLAALEIHVPQWRFASTSSAADGGEPDARSAPDRLVLDLDPGPGVGLRQCARVAFLVRNLLAGMGLDAVPVTSGSKGIHVYAPLDGNQTSEEVSAVARELARALEKDHPDDIVSSMKRDLRPGKVFIDWSQNNGNKTTIAPYSLRGRARPTVAAPRTWRELASPHLRHLEFREVLDRVERRGDPLAALTRESASVRTSERLEVYRSKRDPTRTPEPVPEAYRRNEAPARADSSAADTEPGAPVFVIQRHQARRLHFDFRLEHDGVLVSWALPKGVPTDPKQNHLAVPTEDHPMEYRHFEGTIPKGEYGAGTVRIWDSGTFVLEKWRDDEVIATLTGSAEHGIGGTRTYVLFRTQVDPPQWMIHLKGETGSAKARPTPRRKPASAPLPSALRPMLATRSSAAALERLEADDWSFEMKWDGMRAVVAIDGDDVTVTSRSGRDVTEGFPELLAAVDAVGADSAVIDGEIVALGPNGAPSFSKLQERMGLTGARDIAKARRSAPTRFLAFDVLAINGTDCRALPYEARRELLLDAIATETDVEDDAVDASAISVPPAFDGDAESALRASERLGLEGVVAKRRSSPYRPGTRSQDWLKVPLFDTTEVIVIGWRASDADPSGFASLLLAVPEAGGLQYAGRVASGFTAAERRHTRRRLQTTERPDAPIDVPSEARLEAHWVAPESVGEVTFRERTPEGRLRHAVWRGWRHDRDASEFVADT
ncbi:ATP-dependent DNA ligase [Leucobacter sp. NPDC077196]|uniref:ATP-dependent DNA ligase n=1 Tax=Leucobacter sp. NPDC077196 TaxID=3154959 RepID=UPI00342FAE2A